jgi:hypothetical protein
MTQYCKLILLFLCSLLFSDSFLFEIAGDSAKKHPWQFVSQDTTVQLLSEAALHGENGLRLRRLGENHRSYLTKRLPFKGAFWMRHYLRVDSIWPASQVNRIDTAMFSYLWLQFSDLIKPNQPMEFFHYDLAYQPSDKHTSLVTMHHRSLSKCV